MEMLNRYLQAVGQYLPAETKDDTLEELRANLLEQMDVLAEELERPLTEGEVAAILKAHGKPEVVAVRYLPQRSLIGPRARHQSQNNRKSNGQGLKPVLLDPTIAGPEGSCCLRTIRLRDCSRS